MGREQLTSPQEAEKIGAIRIIRGPTLVNKACEVLYQSRQGTHQIVWESSYGQEVVNPDSETLNHYLDQSVLPPTNPNKPKMLFGTHAEGRCSFDCVGCPFGRTAFSHYDSQTSFAPAVEPALQVELMTLAVKIAQEKGILQPGMSFGAGALLSGDAANHRQLVDFMDAIAGFPGCVSSRFSTIAPVTPNHVLEKFLTGLSRIKNQHPSHTCSVQVSLHSTDPDVRREHCKVQKLYEVDEIAEFAAKATELTGRKPSLAFTLHAGSIIEPSQLGVDPRHVVISLRPVLAPDVRPYPISKTLAVYNGFRSLGYTVVFMRPSPEALELDNLKLQVKG